MPAKNIIKDYLKGGIYHIYNRGVGKQGIFLNDHDYSMFLFYLKLYLDDPDNLEKLDPQKRNYLTRKNFYGDIDLLCYCLMPNHFHLLLKQKEEKAIAEFMKCVATNYSMYFNRKYDRVGHLFQGRYKAALVDDDNYLLHLSRYIHLNSIKEPAKGQTLGKTLGKEKIKKFVDYPYSSYANYSGKKNTEWVKPEFILDYFEENKNDFSIKKASYEKFMKDYSDESKEILKDLILE